MTACKSLLTYLSVCRLTTAFCGRCSWATNVLIGLAWGDNSASLSKASYIDVGLELRDILMGRAIQTHTFMHPWNESLSWEG